MAETKNIIIQGVDFPAPIRYAEGHVLTAVEAKALNQTFHENLRNNFAKTVKASQEGAEGAVSAADLPAKFAEYASAYTFATPSAGGAKGLDPIEKEAIAIAKDILKDFLAKSGRKLTAPKEAAEDEKTAYAEKIAAKVEEIAGREEVLKAAKDAVAKRAKLVAATSADLGLGGEQTAA